MNSHKPKILVFSRSYLVTEFRDNFAPLNDEFDFTFMTDGKHAGTLDTRHAFYKNIAEGGMCTELSADEIEDVRDRCRLMREIDENKSLSMIHAMARVLAQTLDKVQPTVAVSHLIDEYILHLLSILAAHRGIRTVAYCGSYFAGKALVVSNSLGSPLNARMVANDEVSAALETISAATFRQDYRQVTKYGLIKHLKLVGKYWTKLIYYRLKGILENDRLNMHYMMVPYWGDRRSVAFFPMPNLFHKWREQLKIINANKKASVIYIPLSFIPEATTNYWISNRKIINYEDCTLNLVKKISESGITVIIKEHVHMMGIRDPQFYKRLRVLANVVLVHPDENSNTVLAEADAMLIGSGSGGVEATIRGKQVFTYCNTSYWFGPSSAVFLDLDDVSHWSAKIKLALETHVSMSTVEKFEFVRFCLESTARSRSSGKTIFPHINIDDLRGLLLNSTIGT